jgi:DNA-binding transcriptional ArsR family regulator
LASIYNNMVVDSLSTTFAALSDPTRRAILSRLQAGPASVHQLAEPFAVSQQAISKHLAYLERAQLIDKRREGREHICHLNPTPVRELAAWVEQYQQFWTDALGQLDGLLHDLHAPKKGKQP